MKLFNFTIIKLTLYLIVGILLGTFYVIDLKISVYLSISLTIIIGISLLITRDKFGHFYGLGFLICLTVISLGILTVNLHDKRYFKNHYTNFINEDIDSLHKIQFRIREVLKPGNYYDKYIVDILSIDKLSIRGRSLLNIKKDSLQNKLNVDDTFIAFAQLKNLIDPLNPHQFDYKAYLKKKYIYHQIFIESNQLFQVKASKKPFMVI